MILILSRYTKIIALTFYLLLYGELVAAHWNDLHRSPFAYNTGYYVPSVDLRIAPGIPEKLKVVSAISKRSAYQPHEMAVHKPFTGGPSQPEMQSFQSVNANNMVDLFTGDFSYNIPLMDVGGYPINIGYRSGITMDQEASWVGLGWNINPGTITRNMRGLPDDFDGKDSVRKVTSIKENRTIGVNTSVGFELGGLPLNLNVGLGIFHNTYKGWGLETSLNASLNSGNSAKGGLTGGLSLTNNTDEGVTITPSLSVKIGQHEEENTGASGSFSLALPYNTRYGLKGLQMDVGVRQSAFNYKDQQQGYTMSSFSNNYSSVISFASPSYSPTISIPYTSNQFTYTTKLGGEYTIAFPNFSFGGYLSRQFIAPRDTLQILPAYGYLYYQDGARNSGSLLDFNREKEMPYREKPTMPHIALPIYTYDAFSITGEGTGGMFRAYRGDIGFVFDHYMRTRDESDRLSGDVGLGNLVHLGTDLNVNRTFTQNGPWLAENSMKNVIAFKNNNKSFEAAYFRNPGEKSINSKKFYNAIGGDDVVTVKLFQSDKSSPVIQATNFLTRYRNKKVAEEKILKADSAVKTERDKRTQVISYLTAQEAGVAGLSKYIENYEPNAFGLEGCSLNIPEDGEGSGTGLLGEYYRNEKWQGDPSGVRVDNNVDRNLGFGWPDSVGFIRGDYFSIRWLGRLKAPVTGAYSIYANTDDGVQVWLNDSCIITHIEDHSVTTNTSKNVAVVNLLKDEFYTIKIEYHEIKKDAAYHLEWKIPGSSTAVAIPKSYLYLPAVDTLLKSNNLTREKRINVFRKPNHLSEIDVLNNDGRRYVYGIPVYNFKQKEATFALNTSDGNTATGLAHFTNGQDNTTNNHKGKDNFFSSEESPAYAHSFLLTGILSPDYVDLTSNGITDDDLGDAVRINYSKISGVRKPFRWRLPYVTDSVTYNEGLKTYDRDDKGSYVYGEKELWYLHSIQSKTMVATFVTECRKDLLAIDEAGHKYDDGTARRLKEINLYSKSDLLKYPGKAKPIKTVHFEYSYELCRGMNQPLNDSGKLTLKRIWFTYNGNKKGKQNPYVFNYNTKNERYNTRNYDRWGNFKDPADNPGSKASAIVPNAEYPYALQDSVKGARNAATWSLDSIYLPSGGSIKVDFESDDYAYVQNRRAMEMFRVIGLANTTNINDAKSWLYDVSNDYRYVFLRVPRPVTSVDDVKKYYLKDLKKVYFKLFVKMPGDIHGKGYEYVPGYADLSDDNAYGRVDAHRIWIRLAGMSVKGDGPGNASPLAKTAIQFLRLNLPSQAYPGVEAADNLGPAAAIRLINALGMNMMSSLRTFETDARGFGRAKEIDTSRSFIRLLTPYYKKMGGGHRVKRITIYDNWNKMTGQRTTKYGQEYTYTTREEIDGVEQSISSGVAIYEPGIGGEENPFHEPIEYVEKIAPLGPVTLGYSEEPLGESLFPSPGIGYSQVRVRTINYKNIKSANGYEETSFYTARDFPTFTDRSIIDVNTKKRFKPGLSNFLRINARHFLAFSQGFKIELNDMHGKLKSQATYSELDALRPVTYTKNVYRVENQQMDQQRLNNTVTAISPDGTIDTTAVIGKDIELMVDMREQLSVNNGANIHINLDIFAAVVYPVFVPSFYLMPQREENKFRSVAVTKVIQRYGILDSVIHVDKGSKVSTKDLMYDGETGNALLTQTQNEFNDPVYNFTYPAHWAYDGMGLAYKNIGFTLRDASITNGKMTSDNASDYFTGGDEILVAGKQKADALTCTVNWSTFRSYTKIWAIDSSLFNGGPRMIYFIDKYGKPYNGRNVTLTVTRSGRRNMLANVGSITALDSLVRKNTGTGNYQLAINAAAKIVAASAVDFKQLWQVDDIRRKGSMPITSPDWQFIGSPRCDSSSGHNTGYLKYQQQDMNPCSSTAGTTRWVVDTIRNCSSCATQAASYMYTDVYQCRTIKGVYTGIRERQKIDTAQCSATYGNILWDSVGINEEACPPPAACNQYKITVPNFVPENDPLYIEYENCSGVMVSVLWASLTRQIDLVHETTWIRICMHGIPYFKYGPDGEHLHIPEIHVDSEGSCGSDPDPDPEP